MRPAFTVAPSSPMTCPRKVMSLSMSTAVAWTAIGRHLLRNGMPSKLWLTPLGSNQGPHLVVRVVPILQGGADWTAGANASHRSGARGRPAREELAPGDPRRARD